jgi:hypothetical protein
LITDYTDVFPLMARMSALLRSESYEAADIRRLLKNFADRRCDQEALPQRFLIATRRPTRRAACVAFAAQFFSSLNRTNKCLSVAISG